MPPRKIVDNRLSYPEMEFSNNVPMKRNTEIELKNDYNINTKLKKKILGKNLNQVIFS